MLEEMMTHDYKKGIPLEKANEVKLRKYAIEKGCLVKKVGDEGWPDRMFVTPTGIIFFIECKRTETSPLTPAQQRRIPTLLNNKVMVFIVWDLKTGKDIIDKFLGLEPCLVPLNA
jgi:hypothetical protein